MLSSFFFGDVMMEHATPSVIWVLRDGISGEAFTSTNIEPENINDPVEWDFTHAYWTKEKVTLTKVNLNE